MTTRAQATSLQHRVVVNAPIECAFAIFTDDFGDFKPSTHNLLGVAIAETVFEPRVGGHVYDRGVDGSECHWARVLVYEPPHRVVFSWDIDPRWQLETDRDKTSEVDVRFTAQGDDRTLVKLEHRHLERHGEGWVGVRDAIDSDGGWLLYLRRFAELAAAQIDSGHVARSPLGG